MHMMHGNTTGKRAREESTNEFGTPGVTDRKRTRLKEQHEAGLEAKQNETDSDVEMAPAPPARQPPMKLRGLPNWGVTCFANSGIQLMTMVPDFLTGCLRRRDPRVGDLVSVWG